MYFAFSESISLQKRILFPCGLKKMSFLGPVPKSNSGLHLRSNSVAFAGIFIFKECLGTVQFYSAVIFAKGSHYEDVLRVCLVESVGRIFLGKSTKCTAAKAICSSGKAAVTSILKLY